MKKRIIISVLLLIIICAIGIMSYSPLRNKIEQIFFATKVYNLLNSEEYMNLHQVITKDSVNSRTIMWQSLNDREDFILEYKQENEDEIFKDIFESHSQITHISSSFCKTQILLPLYYIIKTAFCKALILPFFD